MFFELTKLFCIYSKMAFLIKTKIRYFLRKYGIQRDADPPIETDSFSPKIFQPHSPLPVGDGNMKILTIMNKHLIQHEISVSQPAFTCVKSIKSLYY